MESDSPNTRSTTPESTVQIKTTVSTDPDAEQTDADQTLTAEEQAAKRTQMYIIAGAVVFLILLVAAIVLMASYPQATSVVRDIALVFVAVETFLIGLAMILLIFQIQVLIQVLRDEIQPLLRSVNDTASTVRGTTEFVSHNVVSPIIQAAGFASGVGRVFRDMVGVVKATRPRTTVQAGSNEEGGKTYDEAE
jgi:hypothetical protein